MDNLSIRKVQHPQAPNNYRVILKTEHNGEFEIGSVGVDLHQQRHRVDVGHRYRHADARPPVRGPRQRPLYG
jgi:hypothetical protein